jgi:hypothetical protein
MQASFRLSTASNSFFAAEAAGDVLFCPGTSNQRILIGNKGGATPMLTIDADRAVLGGDLLPDVNESRNLGSTSMRFKDIFLSGSTIDLGGTLLQRSVEGGAVRITDGVTGDLKRLVVDEIQVGSGAGGSNVMVLQRAADNTLRVLQLATDDAGNPVAGSGDTPAMSVDPITSNVAYTASNAAFFASSAVTGGDASFRDVSVVGGITLLCGGGATTIGSNIVVPVVVAGGSNTVAAPTTFVSDVGMLSGLAVGGWGVSNMANSVIQVRGVPDERAALTTSLAALTSQPHLRFLNPNGAVGSVQTSGSTTSYNTTSDHRLKEQVEPLADAIADMMQLRPVSFKFRADPADPEERVQGFIAHEVQAVVPLAVSGAKDAVDAATGLPVYQVMDASKLIPLLTAAMQEQQRMINLLQSRM